MPAPIPALASNAQTPTSWIDRLLYLGTLLFVAVACSSNLPDPDLWGHVEYARDALRFGIPATTTYSYTAEGYPWVNHELLAEFLQAAGMDTLGWRGVLIAKCLLGVMCLGVVMAFGRRGNPSALSHCFVTLLIAMCMSYFWCVRPQLLTFVSFTVLLAVLSFCFDGWQGRWRLKWPAALRDATPLEYSSRRMKWLWLVPIIFVFWTNSHGGFVAGIAIFAAYLTCRAVEVVLDRGRAATGLLKRFALMLAAVVLVTFINPYGPGLHTGLWLELGAPRPEIVEWQPPEFALYMLAFWILTALWLIALIASPRPRDFTELFVMTCLLEQSLMHRRHIPFFAIAFGFWMVPHVDATLQRFGIGRVRHRSGATPMFWKGAFGVSISLVIGLAGNFLFGRQSDMPVRRAEYPVDAFQFVADQKLTGKMVVNFNWAQYAIAAFGQKTPAEPGILVHSDGRFRTCFSQELLDMQFDFMIADHVPRYRSPKSGRFEPARILEYGQPDLVLISRGHPTAVNAMFRNQDRWTLLFQDQTAQVWGRTTKYGDSTSSTFIPIAARRITNEKRNGSVTWPALPRRSYPARS